MVPDIVKLHYESNFISRYVIVPRVKSTNIPSHKFTNYTRILGTILYQRKLYAMLPPQSIRVYVSDLIFYFLCVSETRQIWQYWKGNIPKVLLEEVLMLCSFLPSQFQPKSPHTWASKSSELAVMYMPTISIFT